MLVLKSETPQKLLHNPHYQRTVRVLSAGVWRAVRAGSSKGSKSVVYKFCWQFHRPLLGWSSFRGRVGFRGRQFHVSSTARADLSWAPVRGPFFGWACSHKINWPIGSRVAGIRNYGGLWIAWAGRPAALAWLASGIAKLGTVLKLLMPKCQVY